MVVFMMAILYGINVSLGHSSPAAKLKVIKAKKQTNKQTQCTKCTSPFPTCCDPCLVPLNFVR